MAYVRSQRSRCRVDLKIDTKRLPPILIDIKPTRQGIRQVQKLAEEAEYRIKTGQTFEAVRRWLRGEEEFVADPLPEVTLGEYAQEFLDTHDVRKRSIDGYTQLYNRWWLETFDHRDPRGLTKLELKRHLSNNATNVGWKVKQNAVSVLNMILDIAAEDMDFTNPISNWAIKRGQKLPPDPYSKEERDQLLAALDDIAQAWTPPKHQPGFDPSIAKRFIELGFDTGMRTGELLGLRWHNVHIEERKLMVTESVTAGNHAKVTKTGDWREVLISQRTANNLSTNPTRFRDSFVFLNTEHRHLINADDIMANFKKAHDLSGVRRRVRSDNKPKPYPWRSTYISISLSEGMIPSRLCEMTGHDLRTMYDEYAGFIPDDGHKRAMVDSIFR